MDEATSLTPKQQANLPFWFDYAYCETGMASLSDIYFARKQVVQLLDALKMPRSIRLASLRLLRDLSDCDDPMADTLYLEESVAEVILFINNCYARLEARRNDAGRNSQENQGTGESTRRSESIDREAIASPRPDTLGADETDGDKPPF